MWIRSGWLGQVWAKRLWSTNKPLWKNHRARFWENATGPLPVSHFQTRLCSSTYGTDHIMADCVIFVPNGSCPEASRCAKIIRSDTGQHFRTDPDRIRHVYWAVMQSSSNFVCFIKLFTCSCLACFNRLAILKGGFCLDKDRRI